MSKFPWTIRTFVFLLTNDAPRKVDRVETVSEVRVTVSIVLPKKCRVGKKKICVIALHWGNYLFIPSMLVNKTATISKV